MRFVDKLLHIVGGSLVILLLITVTAGIVSRALNAPFSWTEEASGYLMVWLTCVGWMIATRRGEHIRIQFFQQKLSSMYQTITERVIQSLLCILGIVLVWYGSVLFYNNLDIESIALPISAAWLYFPLPIAGIFTSGQALHDLANFKAKGISSEVMQ